MQKQELILKTEEETKKLAIKLATQIKKGSIIAISGSLGTGKTFLCRHIIKYLSGEDVKEIYELGIEEAFSGNHVCLIEWPEIISNILPKNTISIKISLNSDNTRLVSIYKI